MTEQKISPADIEAKFRDVQGQVDTVAEDSKKPMILGGVVVSVLLVVLIYVLGQRAGRRKSTVLEIRRI